MGYLSPEILAGFAKYKLVPRRIAPNTLTMSGFLCTLSLYLVLAYFDPHFWSSSSMAPHATPLIPNWVWLFGGIAAFFAHTLDGIDGKQARRTGSSSPLGELVDHGVDSWTVMLQTTVAASIFGRGHPYGISSGTLFLLLFFMSAQFINSHWEKYNTGILFLPWAYDISQIMYAGAMLFSYFFTPSFWHFQLIYDYNTKAGYFSPADVLVIITIVSFFLMSLPMTLYNIYDAWRRGALRQPTLFEAMRPLIPFTTLFAGTFVWVLLSPGDLLREQPRLLLWFVGTLFSHTTIRLIVSDMSLTRCQAWHWLLYPLLAVDALLGVAYVLPGGRVAPFVRAWELTALYTLALLATLQQLHYGYCLIYELADFLNIRPFSIERKTNAPTSATGSSTGSESGSSSTLPMRAGVPTSTPLMGPSAGLGSSAAGYLLVESSVLDKKEGGGRGGSSLHEFNSALGGAAYGPLASGEGSGSTLSPRTGRARSPKTS